MKKRNGNRWTEARYRAFIRAVLRRGSTKWGVRYDVLNKAKRGKIVNKNTNRLAEHYECNKCHNLFPLKQVEVDHIIPIDEFSSWDETIERMFCEEDNLQVLCKECHKEKTLDERTTRRKNSKTVQRKQK